MVHVTISDATSVKSATQITDQVKSYVRRVPELDERVGKLAVLQKMKLYENTCDSSKQFNSTSLILILF